MTRTAEVILEYQDTIDRPPVPPEALQKQSCANDAVTIKSWQKVWIDQTRTNKAAVGSFKDHSVGKLFGAHQHKPCILAGSGPSLRVNGDQLKDRNGIPLISCLHNFHFFEDRDVRPDYYVSLDSGPVTIEEVSEGGKLREEEYWERTAQHTLICYVGTHPDLIKKWRGKKYFFNAHIPDKGVMQAIGEIERFNMFVGSGGNVLGACLYIAKGILGCTDIAFTGADFSFGYDHKFHGWDSKYDANLGHCVHLTDVYGVRRRTWQSYANFKSWFDWKALTVPGGWYNCTEGGCLGSYPEGNLSAFKYMDLKDFYEAMNMNRYLKDQCENPETEKVTLLF